MANYANLKATINANIKANGTEAITGPVLNSVLTAAVNTLGAGYQFMGVATTSTNPGTPDANVFYIAATPGTYTNFGGKTVADGEVAILKYNGTWTKEVTGAATAAQLTQLGQEVGSNYVVRITSWGNTDNITAIGQVYWSQATNTIRRCISEPFDAASSYVLVPWSENCLYLYGNTFYRYIADQNKLVILGVIDYLTNQVQLTGAIANFRLIPKQLRVWCNTNNQLYTDSTGTLSVCFRCDTFSTMRIVNRTQTKNDYFAFTEEVVDAAPYPAVIQRVAVTAGGGDASANIPATAKYVIFGIKNETTPLDILVYLDGILINPIVNGFVVGSEVSSSNIDSAAINDSTIEDSIVKNLQYEYKVYDWSGWPTGHYVIYSEETPTIGSDARYTMSNPIPVKKGDYIEVQYTINASLRPSVVSMCDAAGNPTKCLHLGQAADNSIFKTYIEEDGYILVCFNKNYSANYFKKLDFYAVNALYELISTKQAAVSLKTINGISLIGVGDVTIAQGPQGIQGPAGPIGPQGNSGYQGAAGELEVVNNLVDGGQTAALSAEQGKVLGDRTTYNNLPLLVSPRYGSFYQYFDIVPAAFESNRVVSKVAVSHFDLCTKKYRQGVRMSLPSGNTSCEFYHLFDSSFDASLLYLNFGIHIDDDNVEKYTSIRVWMESSNAGSNNRCYYDINTYADAEHSRTGAFYNCLNLYAVGYKQSNFNIAYVNKIGFSIGYTNEQTDKYVTCTDFGFVYSMKKPGVCIIVDNFASAVCDMADYAYSKGIPLNLSIIPNWIGNPGMATLEQIRAAQRQGHFIWNHTWNHVITTQTELQVSEEFFKGDSYLMHNGFSRGSKVYSNPSSFYDNIRYRAQMGSNAQAIYHHWTKYPNGETDLSNPRYLLFNPVYPSTRMMLNISGLDWNNPTDTNTQYFINLAQAALTYEGLAIIGFHGTFWTGNLDEQTLAGDRWKRFIDALAAMSGQNFYTIDDLLEGRFC